MIMVKVVNAKHIKHKIKYKIYLYNREQTEQKGDFSQSKPYYVQSI